MSWKTALVEPLHRRMATMARNTAPSPLISIETIMGGLSAVYGGLVALRADLYANGVLPTRRLPCRVIAIGNLSAGGTGKTPMTIYVARLLREHGHRVVVISRGYRGRMEQTGGVVSDGESVLVGPAEAGDEPYLIARVLKGVPVLVGRHRYEVGMRAVARFRPDVIVFDDAFQHLSLYRDFDLVLMDSRHPYGNGYMLPRGILREPPTALKRANSVVFTRSRTDGLPGRPHTLPASRPVFHTRHVPVIRYVSAITDTFFSSDRDLTALQGKKVTAVAGLADNDQFFELLAPLCRLVGTLSFDDHHPYGADDVAQILHRARQSGCDLIVTTAKDGIKLNRCRNWPVPLVVMDIEVQPIRAQAAFLEMILKTVRRAADVPVNTLHE